MLKAALESLRPRQWTKNSVVFAGLVFDGQLTQLAPFLRVLGAFLLFCLFSSITYLINDLIDLPSDRQHPVKSQRPIASGRLSRPAAYAMLAILILIALPAAYFLSPRLALIGLAYTLLMLLYSKFLKHLVIIDVMTIAAGFVLRVLAGLVVITVNYFSPWLFILTMLLALFLGYGKRYAELKLLDQAAGTVRKVLDGYTLPLLDQYLTIVMAAIAITYMLYTFSIHQNSGDMRMMLTIPFVLYGVFRYTYLMHGSGFSGPPDEVLLRDKPTLITVLLWGLTASAVLYLGAK